ncbi:hypothetical protein GGS26DRAFT_522368 [Hypomontagnella submonticulosa]|nr:hypothetical protein GGS26DRAFT_522368 [Hypomontagnella submonticulosa]
MYIVQHLLSLALFCPIVHCQRDRPSSISQRIGAANEQFTWLQGDGPRELRIETLLRPANQSLPNIDFLLA